MLITQEFVYLNASENFQVNQKIDFELLIFEKELELFMD